MGKLTHTLSYGDAKLVLEAALARANELQVPSSVAVLDAGREVVAFARQDGCPIISGEVALGKAFTSGSTHQPSGDMKTNTEPGGPFWGVQHGVSRPMIVFGGGLPLAIGNDVVGSIGVGGGTVADDEQIAAAGAAALGLHAKKLTAQ